MVHFRMWPSDHFNPADSKAWKQRYFISSGFFDKTDPNAPIFLAIGGEGRSDPGKFATSNMADNLAKHFKAYAFSLEHRFYGESQPFDNWSTKSLQYLTSQQALADLANFIQTMNNTNKELQNRKWIVFGGSYPGNLAAWMRLKYPHLIAGSIASSAPVQAQVDFPEYMEVVQNSLGPECSSEVKNAFSELQNWTKSASSAKALLKLFNLCDLNINSQKTMKNFYSTIIDQFAGVVQYNEDNKPNNNITIDMICDIMTEKTLKNDSAANVVKLSEVFKLLNKDQKECNNVSYEYMINDLKNTTIDFDNAGRQWTYQTCNEFGYYQTTTSPNQPFPIGTLDLHFFTDMCKEVYGSRFDLAYIHNAVKRTNMFYGARNLKADKVMLLNGSIDPWHALGLLNYTYLQTSTKFIRGTAHCADMYQARSTDKPDLKKAREMIKERISVFLKSD